MINLKNVKSIKTNLTTCDNNLEPDKILENAKGNFNELLIMGWNKDGELDIYSSNSLKISDLNYLIDIVKRNLLRGDYTD